MAARVSHRSPRRDSVITAARELMRRSGNLGFTMRTLAEEAGVSIATPYNQFGSKQAILLAVLDADLAEYQTALAALRANEIDVLFQAVELMRELLAGEPVFYRNVLAEVSRDGGPELRHMVSGPRYVLWKSLLRQATEAGLLSDRVDPDAFAITLTQLVFATVLEWAQGSLGLEEMDARIRYGLALSLLAIATERSRGQLLEQLERAQTELQQRWRAALAQRLAAGPLDDETRAIAADQLAAMAAHANEETIG